MWQSTVSRGPNNDSPQFAPTVFPATLAVNPDRLLAEAAYKNDENYRPASEDCGIRLMVIHDNALGHAATTPRT